ncbi:MAG TPA: NAD(P)/FAD-dependent oxidoreductase [Gammaproteobacteria bacterium]|nr:NAD(P)/FAD-dependent oxidoreductase [Gammaproteobacteria bacterium]
MSKSERGRIAVIGGGPAGSLLAILLARRGLESFVIERSPPFSSTAQTGGRSINLALAARGIAALRRAGIEADVAKLLIPMRGRMLHDVEGKQRFLPYGQRDTEQIYSVSRAALNTLLYELAAQHLGVEYRFGEQCVGVERDGTPLIETRDGRRRHLAADVVFAADGAGSEVRRALVANGAITASEELLDHGYKELTLAARDGAFALEANALHIWPRGGFMLIGLPNVDRTFTATLFLPHRGEPSFASVGNDAEAFFAREFPDAVPLLPALARDYASHPVGHLGTVQCKPWSFANRVLLVGDAAHAIVPFHGQGMNAAFEDCVVLDELIGLHRRGEGYDWPAIFAEFEAARAPNVRAIAEMALENYREMRDDVRDPKFQLRADLSFELERRFPDRFIPRYSMVMFHPEISYAEAQRHGAQQARILRELTVTADSLREVDFALADDLVQASLRPPTRR